MTDLEKRADEYANKEVYYGAYVDEEAGREIVKDTYIDATKAETALLSQHIIDLQKDKGNLTDKVRDLEQQIEKMKAELHHRLVIPSHGDSDCLDKIVGLDRLWQFGQEF